MSDATISNAVTPAPVRVRRVFHYNGVILADPGPEMSPEQVKKHYSSAGYPELTNASIVGPESKDGKSNYTFKKTVGTKG